MFYVLIVIIYSSQGSAIATHEYVGQSACKVAGDAFIEAMPFRNGKYICTPKETDHG